MRKRTFIIVTKEELRAELTDWYESLVEGDLREVIKSGGILPKNMAEKGIDNMSLHELWQISDGWAEMTADAEGVSGIMVATSSDDKLVWRLSSLNTLTQTEATGE